MLNINKADISGKVQSINHLENNCLIIKLEQNVAGRIPSIFSIIIPRIIVDDFLQLGISPGDEVLFEGAQIYEKQGFRLRITEIRQVHKIESAKTECDLGEEIASEKFIYYF